MRDRSRLIADLAEALARVPRGRVVPIHVLARHLGLNRPVAARLVASLVEPGQPALAWHRVVAEGGALGRHRLSAEQRRRLQAEGVPVSPAGMVDEFGARAVTDLTLAATPIAPVTAPQTRGRSRGMKDRP